MNKETKLLEELIQALHHNGLNWTYILEDYLEYKIEQKQSSVEEWSETKDNMINFIKKFRLNSNSEWVDSSF